MIPRIIQSKLRQLATGFPAIALLGPRQAGKSTLVQDTFPHHLYQSLEDPGLRSFAQEDGARFLARQGDGPGLVIDEIQRVPSLLSYIQLAIDRHEKPGQFILTGSQNFLLGEQLSQTLAGRVALLTLLPFGLEELVDPESSTRGLEETMFEGSYPRIRLGGLSPLDWYPSYIRTYVERDARQVINIRDLLVFERFLKLCAGRTGQLFNGAEVGRDCGISHHTAHQWLSLLCASYITFLLPPYYENFSKRLIKSPKLYFYDSGLVCSLLGIQSAEQLSTHYLRGGLFESFVISEIIKRRFNRGLTANCYFWRDHAGHEIDCLLERGNGILPIECKSGQTYSKSYFSQLTYWSQLAKQPEDSGIVIYGGDDEQQRSQGTLLSWRKLTSLETS